MGKIKKITKKKIPWLTQNGQKKPVRVAVIGDIILDEYLDGIVNRISPEAPVPVHHVKKSQHTAGGAANVARNIKLAGGEVILCSVCGCDEAASTLKSILEGDHIDTSNVIQVNDRPTVRKTRVSANHHQIVRIDWEVVQPIEAREREEFLRVLKTQEFDSLIMSDYGKGCLESEFLAGIIDIARMKKIPCVVDPKGKDYSRYEGAFLITPNMKEACEALNLDPTESWTGEDLGRKLLDSYKIQNVLVTMGAKGMVLVQRPERGSSAKSIHLPAQARDVFDVSGAGDTVVAMMALGLGAKADFETTMEFANMAAGLVVEKWGTQPVRLEELQEMLETQSEGKKNASGKGFSTAKKIVPLDALYDLIGKKGDRSQRVVFTNGCFDLLHAGHVSYLEEAKNLGEILVVGVNSDDSIRRLKGSSRPIVSLEHRMRLLASLECIDYVVSFDEDTPIKVIEKLLPDVLVKGADWEKSKIVGNDIVTAAGGKVENIKLVPGLSTTDIENRIKKS